MLNDRPPAKVLQHSRTNIDCQTMVRQPMLERSLSRAIAHSRAFALASPRARGSFIDNLPKSPYSHESPPR